MKQVTFIGDPANKGDGPALITISGLTFEKGKPREVEDAEALRRLGGNSHFKVEAKKGRKGAKDGE